LKTLQILALLLAAVPAALPAQTPPAPDPAGELTAVLVLPGDATRGAAVFEACKDCHRKDASGRSSLPSPRLAAQHAPVIVKQLLDIRAGRRQNPPMKPLVDDPALDAQALADVARYLQALPITGNLGKGPGSDLARGKALYAKDCAACHGDRGEGRADAFYPMVAAQHYTYLLRELGLIRNGGRGNSNADMVTLVKTYAPPELEAVADYMARLPPPAP
jgi:cytochrome c553